MNVKTISFEFVLLLWAMILANIASAMLFLLLPLYLEILGASLEQVGVFFSIQMVLAIGSRILGGWISDQIGRIAAIAAGSMLGGLGYLDLAIAPQWTLVIPGILLIEMATSLVEPSFQAYVAEKTPKESLSTRYGLVNGFYLICMIVGPLLGGFLAQKYSYRLMFQVAAGIYGLATVTRVWMAFQTGWGIKTLRLTQLIADVRQLAILLVGGGLVTWLFIVDGFLDTSNQLAIPFFPKYATEIGGINEQTYGELFAVSAIVGAIAMLPCGILSDRIGEHRSIALGACLLSIVWGIVIIAPSPSPFFIAFGLSGITQALIQPAFSALVSKAVPQESLGTTWGVFLTALGILAIPAPFIGGQLYHGIQPEATFILSMIFVVGAIPLALWKLSIRPH